jgi:hypothetical protein
VLPELLITPPTAHTTWSTSQTRAEIDTAAAIMLRKRIRQIGKRSCGRTPRVYANEEIPFVVLTGRVKRLFGIEEFRYRGEELSASWSAKFDGGEYGRVDNESQ